jgi:hypothetical protein
MTGLGNLVVLEVRDAWRDTVDVKAAARYSWQDSTWPEPKRLTVRDFRCIRWSAHGPRLRYQGDVIEGLWTRRGYSPWKPLTVNLDQLMERASSHDLILTSFKLQQVYIDDETRRAFRKYADEWIHDTEAISSLTDMVLHPAYQGIIGLGKPALPLLLEELRVRPDYWFWALRSIAGEDPNKPNPNFDEAVGAWLRWGREHLYID